MKSHIRMFIEKYVIAEWQKPAEKELLEAIEKDSVWPREEEIEDAYLNMRLDLPYSDLGKWKSAISWLKQQIGNTPIEDKK